MFLLLMPAMLVAAPPANPADFPIKVHVVFSRAVSVNQGIPSGNSYQMIEAVIDGQQVELMSNRYGVLKLGDYPARVSTKVHSPKNPNGYDMFIYYDFLMPDGAVVSYQETAVGVSGMPPPPSHGPNP
jgi:hypothetical protein